MGENLFKGTATYYAKYRPMYPSTLVRYLVQRFSLNGEQRLLDIGCGTGQLTTRFSDWCSRIVGLDTDEDMILEAKLLHQKLRYGSIDWIHGDLQEYIQQHNEGFFQLAIIAKAFHWMEREKTLELLYPLLNKGGGIALIDAHNPDSSEELWKRKFKEVVTRWYGKERRAGNTTYRHPDRSYETIIKDSDFDLEVHRLPSYQVAWTVETIIGNLYSTSYGAKRFLGNKEKEFETEAREVLLFTNPAGVFQEQVGLTIKMAIK
ncbi:class I SAM-dependent methyltransferase [Sediminibacillus halophilus]|uniref:Ubiquinone/menaquinone biosynthesis C-methylase UbiE n=1 Tax=Sediminibacillus halophilus TaxID=482461 RepID=A0A1G9PCN1_9BACI|nr:class I SAM-dependent methyltransferase [Sediminibacillus halophilus]SDL95905.1 Ubiquinone/menaquinone biosynthesis C-methylase UbiE [Sediminibacillus halophilus]